MLSFSRSKVMRVLLLWSLLAGPISALYYGGSDDFKTVQTQFNLQDDKDIGDRHGKRRSQSIADLKIRRSTLQRRALPRKGSIRSSSTPNFRHDSGLQPSKVKNQAPLQGLDLKTKTLPEISVAGSHISSYHTPFGSAQSSPTGSPRGSTSEHPSRSGTPQRQRSDASVNADSMLKTASSQILGSSEQMFTRKTTKAESESKTPEKPGEKGFASQIGKQLLWIQNNPVKAIRMGTSITANAASGAAAIAAAHRNVPGAACLAIASATMKIGIDCYDSRDKVQSWHKQKGIDPKENVEATKRVISAAKKPALGLWRTVSKPLAAQQSDDKPWPIDNLPVRRRGIRYRLAE